MSIEIAAILRQITLWFLIGALIQIPILVLRFAWRKAGSRAGNLAFSLLLCAFSLNLIYHLFILLKIFQHHPSLLYLPVYCTLAFGPLLFFYIKLSLFSNYQLRWSDAKHIVLPLAQIAYFFALFIQPIPFKMQLKRSLISPFYGGMEMLLYIITFYAYLYFSWRFVRFRKKQLRHHTFSPAMRQARLLNQYLWGMFILFFFNSTYIATDFISYDLMHLNLHALPGFTRLGELSYATLVWWSCLHGWRLWIIDWYVSHRRKKQTPPPSMAISTDKHLYRVFF